jgi:hypothetical protein
LFPPLFIYLRVGELTGEVPMLRVLGFGLNVYAAVESDPVP